MPRTSPRSLLLSLAMVGGCLRSPAPVVEPPGSSSAVAVVVETQPVVEIPVLGLELGLPARPAFVSPAVAVVDADGLWSVRGLHSLRDAMLPAAEDSEIVLVSGYVQEVYEPPVCPEDELCPPGKMPHLWITDDPAVRGKADALMVVDTQFAIPEWDTDAQRMWADSTRPEYQVGRHYVWMGWFSVLSESGFAHDRGLLQLFAVTDYPLRDDSVWIVPPNSRFHPRALAAAGSEPLTPEVAALPPGLREGAPLPDLGALVEPRDIDHAEELGRLAAEASDARRSDYYYRWLIVTDPDSARGWVGLANMYIDFGEVDPGFAIIDLALARQPNSSSLHHTRARMLLDIGQPHPAIESYRRALELDSDRGDALYGLGMAYAEAGMRREAIETLTRFLELGGGSPAYIQRAAQDVILRMDAPL